MTPIGNLARALPAILAALLLVATPSMAADVRWSDLDGKTHRLTDYRGQWVLVNYWATWCPPCLEELPELEQFHVQSGGKATVLGVNTESIGGDALRAFVGDWQLSYPIMRAAANPRTTELIGPVEGLPTSFLITPRGEVVARQVGTVTADGIRRFIENHDAAQRGNQ
jgi:thiol-disulfide isomerase/thioredoxin